MYSLRIDACSGTSEGGFFSLFHMSLYLVNFVYKGVDNASYGSGLMYDILIDVALNVMKLSFFPILVFRLDVF